MEAGANENLKLQVTEQLTLIRGSMHQEFDAFVTNYHQLCHCFVSVIIAWTTGVSQSLAAGVTFEDNMRKQLISAE